MDDVVELLGWLVIGAVLAVPLLYALSTLLGMRHKQFRPIFHRTRPDGTTVPVLSRETEPSIENRTSRTPRRQVQQGGNEQW